MLDWGEFGVNETDAAAAAGSTGVDALSRTPNLPSGGR